MADDAADIEPIPISFEVGDPANLGEACTIAAWLFVPPKLAERPLAMVLLHGGTYSKGYWHIVVPGHPGYSPASYFAQQGWVVLVVDHLGTGESTMPQDGTRVTVEAMAAANAAVTEIFRERLAKGDLAPGLPPLPDPFMVGVGHSLGGYLAQVQQAEHDSYDAVAILGSTCQLMVGLDDPEQAQREILPAEQAGYFLMPRAQAYSKFYYPDVPAEVIAVDDLSFSPLPFGMTDVGMPGRTAPHAAKIATPVFLAFGEIDLSRDPYAEPAFYPASPDVTLFLLPRSGHCHNTASTRRTLWRRLADWTRAISTIEDAG